MLQCDKTFVGICPAASESARELKGDIPEIKKNENEYRRMFESLVRGLEYRRLLGRNQDQKMK